MSAANLPIHVYDEDPICPDCGLEREPDDVKGGWVHPDGEKDCPPRVYAWVKYNASRIIELVCDGCLMVRERASEDREPRGVKAIYESGVVICKRCGKVAE